MNYRRSFIYPSTIRYNLLLSIYVLIFRNVSMCFYFESLNKKCWRNSTLNTVISLSLIHQLLTSFHTLPFLCMYVCVYAHMNFPFAKTLSSSLQVSHFTPKCLTITSHNSNSISTSFKTLRINLIQQIDHTQIFSECPQSIFYSLCWYFLFQDPVRVYTLYLSVILGWSKSSFSFFPLWWF